MTKILVADDDTVMLGLLTTLMELEGNSIATVTRPEEVVPAVEHEQPDFILMDYHLAGGDVIEALIDLKSRQDLRQIPVLITSGMDREAACLQAGADGFILKPFRPAQLLERIEEMLAA